jgi:hypothetical protein
MRKIHQVVRRFRRIVIGLLLLMLLTCVLLCVLVHRVLAAEPKPGWDIMFLIDSSNSMAESYDAVHLQAQQMLVRYLDTVEQPVSDRIGLIRFGTEAQLEIPLTSTGDILAQGLLKEVWQSQATSLGWTDPRQALELAYAELYSSTRYLPTQRQVVILVTDGEPATPFLSTPAAMQAYGVELQGIIRRMKRHDALFLTVTLNNGTIEQSVYPTPYRTLWQELTALTPPATYHELSAVGQLPDVFHEIAAQLGGHASLDAYTIEIGAVAAQDVNLERELLRAVFTIYGPTSTSPVQLKRPGGAAVRFEDPDVRISRSREGDATIIYVIDTPRPGRWTLASDENQQVQVWIDGLIGSPTGYEAVYQLEVEAPTHLLVGVPWRAYCQLLGDDKQLLPQSGIQVKAVLLRAGFKEAQLLGTKQGDKYVLQQDDLAAGVYTLLVKALQAGRVVAEYETIFEVSTLPRLQVTQPISGQKLRPGTVIMVLANVDCPYSCGSSWVRPAEGLVTGFITSDDLKTKRIVLTRAFTSSEYTAVITGLVPGFYRLTIQLEGKTREHLPYEDVTTLSFQVLPPSRAPVNLWLWIWGGVLISLASMGGWLGWQHQQQRPHLAGRWRIQQSPPTAHVAGYLPLPITRQRFTLKQTHLPGLPTAFSMEARRGPDQELEIWLKPGTKSQPPILKLNDHQVTAPIALMDGDILSAGPYRLRYENVRQEARQRALGHQ